MIPNKNTSASSSSKHPPHRLVISNDSAMAMAEVYANSPPASADCTDQVSHSSPFLDSSHSHTQNNHFKNHETCISLHDFMKKPYKCLAETSRGVREAVQRLSRLDLDFECPRCVLLVVKPDQTLLLKVFSLIVKILETDSEVKIFVQDFILEQLQSAGLLDSIDTQLHCERVLAWNPEMLMKQIGDNISRRASFGEAHAASADNIVDPGLASEEFCIPGSVAHLSNRFERLHSPSDIHSEKPNDHTDTASRVDEGTIMMGDHANSEFHEQVNLGFDLSYNNNNNNNNGSQKHSLKDPEKVDLIITMGGDGTVLYAAWLFQRVTPPILPFHLGTLGFLTVFEHADYEQIVERVFGGAEAQGSNYPSVEINALQQPSRRGFRINLRMRLKCSVYRARTVQTPAMGFYGEKKSTQPGNQLDEHYGTRSESFDSTSLRTGNHVFEHADQINKNSPAQPSKLPIPDEEFHILNDVVVDRGPSPYMSSLEVFGDGEHLTTVQADGLVLATPTGSTAYSLSAGGSIVHPLVSAISLTPICPHTLSFRPMLLPDSMEIKIVVPKDSRSSAWASFDGRHRLKLERGDALVVQTSEYPVPTMCNKNQTSDWFGGLRRSLGWNERAAYIQKSFVWGVGVVENT